MKRVREGYGLGVVSDLKNAIVHIGNSEKCHVRLLVNMSFSKGSS